MRARNTLFDLGLRQVERLPVPVVSVGNLAAGGTGKTPLVRWLCEAARRAGRWPGVLARGYGRAGGAALNDEGAMLAARLPDLPQEQDPDRVAGGQRLIARGVDLIVLDDGFQHRRIHRDHDWVCLDARQPFAWGLLPAGRLREPRSALRRADLAVLTRSDGIPAAELADLRVVIARAAGKALPVCCAVHAPCDLLSMPAGELLELAALAGRRVGLLSAIARPDAFERTVADLGAEIAWSQHHRDHHRFTPGELAAIAERARRDDVTLVVTEKDEPKLAPAPLPRWVLRIDLRFTDEEPALP